MVIENNVADTRNFEVGATLAATSVVWNVALWQTLAKYASMQC